MTTTTYALEPGDHIYVPRTEYRLRYTHHGLYLGDGQVVQYSGHSSDELIGRIEIVSMDEFRQGASVNMRYYQKRRHGRLASISRALSRLGEKFYNVIFNNCEHFVTWCITGIHRSKQIEGCAIKATDVGTEQYTLYRVSTVLLKELELLSPFRGGTIEMPPLAKALAGRVSRMMGKYATQAIGKHTVREAHRMLTAGLRAVTKMAASALPKVVATLPLSQGFAIAVAAFATLELFSAATGIVVRSMPPCISDVIGGVVRKICSTAKGFFRSAVEAVKSVGGRVWSGAGKLLGGCFNWVVNLF